MTATVTRPSVALDFLETLYGGAHRGWHVQWSAVDKKAHPFHVTDLERAATHAADTGARLDTYYSVGLQSDKPVTGRGTAETVTAIPGLWADIDISGPAHKQTALPPTVGDALSLLAVVPFEPTVIVSTGHGLHCYWLFKEPWYFDSDVERRDAESMMKRFQLLLRRAATEHGWTIDSTADFARVLRLPGTMNHKLGERQLVQVIERDDDARYNRGDFDLYLPDAAVVPRTTAARSGGRKFANDADFEPANFEMICNECAWMQHTRDDAATLSEPEWRAALSITARCVDGENVSHVISQPYPGYTHAETQQKHEQALRRAGPQTCTYIRHNLDGEPYCSGCRHWDTKTTTPLQLGRRVASINERAKLNGHALQVVEDNAPLPVIDAGDKNLARVSAIAWESVQRRNLNPRMFLYAGLPTRIETDEKGVLVPRLLTENRLRHELARAAQWTRMTAKGASVDASPPVDVVKDMLAHANIPLPALTTITEVPVFLPNGVLHAEPGYSAQGRIYYQPRAGFTVRPVPPQPSGADLARAKDLILTELLGDFPFVGEAERAHAVALQMQSFVRAMIDGPTPLFLIEKPSPGTGASLLANALTYPMLGREPSPMTEGGNEDEWRKRLTAHFLSGSPVLFVDNLRDKLDSSSLSSALTSMDWSDRVLSTSGIANVPVRCTFVATGNNPLLSSEISRRVIRIRLDAHQDRPWLREKFRHADLRGWVKEQRAELIWAVLVLVRHWVAESMPKARAMPTLGMYESWVSVIGGILGAADIPGFLDNLDELYEQSDDEGSQIRAFLFEWWTRHGGSRQSTASLYDIASSSNALLDLGGKGPSSEKIKLGIMLKQLRDRHYDLSESLTVRITDNGKKVQGATVWRLQDVARDNSA